MPRRKPKTQPRKKAKAAAAAAEDHSHTPLPVIGIRLCIVTSENIFGINLDELTMMKKVVVDWKSLSPPPAKFRSRAPEHRLRPFLFDSNIYLTAGYQKPYSGPSMLPSRNVYQFDIDKKKKIVPSESIPKTPTPFAADSFIANVSGAVYFLACSNHIMDDQSYANRGLWVLRPGLQHWHKLCIPPPLESPGFSGGRCKCLLLQSKLFLQADVNSKSRHWSFDFQKNCWFKENNKRIMSHLFSPIFGGHYLPAFLVSVPGLGDHNVVKLSWSYPSVSVASLKYSLLADVKLNALVLNQSGVALILQELEECFKGIKPIFNYASVTNTVVDLGNNMFCALIYGPVVEHDHPLLCISVFTLTKDADADPYAFPDPGPKPEPAEPLEQRFLSVNVLRKCVFTMKEYGNFEYLSDAFRCP